MNGRTKRILLWLCLVAVVLIILYGIYGATLLSQIKEL